MHRRILYFLLFLTLIPALLSAGTRGRIKGKVVDMQTGDPLIGANVIVMGTTIGAATDANGEYLLINLEPGVYEVRASYLGYQTVTVSNVRVSADLTTELDFELPSEDIQVGTVEIVAQKPLIQKDNTNAIRVTTSEDIQALPVRGVNNIIGLTAGVTLQNGEIYIRGGRNDEVGYYLEGVSIKNPITGRRGVTISQDALEEIQVQAGGYTAEFGGANAGIIRQQFKSGGPQLKASYEYITDNVTFKSKSDAFDGEKRLGAHWWGYNEQSATLSGPLFSDRVKFFTNVNYRYDRDPEPQPWPGMNLGVISDPISNDTIDFYYPAGPLKGQQREFITYTGTLNFDLKPVLIRLSGTFTTANGATSAYSAIQDLLQTRRGKYESNDGALNLKITHVLTPSMYYEVSAGYYFSNYEQYTPGLGSNIWVYGDSVANAEAGWTIPRTAKDIANGVVGRYVSPTYANIYGFDFVRDGTVPVGYGKNDRQGISLNASLSFLVGKNHSFKVGGEYQTYTLRNWSLGTVSQVGLAASVDQFINSSNYDGTEASLNAYKRQLLITRGVNNYGYDVFGNKVDDGFFDAPHKPVFAAAYIQDRIEYEDLVINAGVRFDYIDIDNLKLVDPAKPDLGINATTGELYEEGWEKVPTFSAVSPRLGFSFPVTDRTVFHAQFGKFIQQPALNTAYRGLYRVGFEIKGGFFIPQPAGFNLRPTRTTQYELGFTQQLTDFMSIDITGYYKDIKDQVQFTLQNTDRNSAFQSYNVLTNGDYATTKGVEITLNMRRYERLAMNASLSFQDARGTGSNPYSNSGIVGAPLDGVTIFVPKYISPLSYNQALRGNVNVDYRFGPNDGPALLHDFGVSVLAMFNSGHPFTRGIGSLNAESDARFRQPIEALNTSTTPGEFQVDLRIDKTFRLMDKLSLNVYVYVINLFDNLNIRNVFLRTGSPEDDGVIYNPELSQQLIATYGEKYIDLYKAINVDYQQGYGGVPGAATNLMYGPPRQIRLGVRLEY
ncbi:TonB-dependent receptor [Melioribacter sp. Ez-97]|uniref:TonB-dependent receptor n=1 Tax=Melioribacter sp. Ez-97 TaxID=3423434 RepID=UPI003EDAB757